MPGVASRKQHQAMMCELLAQKYDRGSCVRLVCRAQHVLLAHLLLAVIVPFPQVDIIGSMVIVWRARGKIIRSVLCNIVYNNCAQCDAHTYEQTNSSLDWVLSLWAHFTVLIFICVLCITVCCMHA